MVRVGGILRRTRDLGTIKGARVLTIRPECSCGLVRLKRRVSFGERWKERRVRANMRRLGESQDLAIKINKSRLGEESDARAAVVNTLLLKP